MNYEPLPKHTHSEPCTCPEVEPTTPCYVWIHRPFSPGRVVTFNKISDAYDFGIKLIFYERAAPLNPVDSADSTDITWTAQDGTHWLCPDTVWDVKLCKILTDVSQNVKPFRNHWCYISTEMHQVLIGLGSNIPDEDIPMRGYTLEEHDKPEDMPPLLYLSSSV